MVEEGSNGREIVRVAAYSLFSNRAFSFHPISHRHMCRCEVCITCVIHATLSDVHETSWSQCAANSFLYILVQIILLDCLPIIVRSLHVCINMPKDFLLLQCHVDFLLLQCHNEEQQEQQIKEIKETHSKPLLPFQLEIDSKW